MNKNHITGFILAGGKSTRMGTDKAMLNFRGKPLLKHMFDVIRPHCGKVFISGDKPDYGSLGIAMVSDIYPGIGPVSGIFSALKYSETDWNIVISVDSPMINNELLEYLISNTDSYECVVPKHEAGMEPLIALYSKQILPTLEIMIGTGNYKMKNILTQVKTNALDCQPLLEKYPNLFMNLNRMEDYLSV